MQGAPFLQETLSRSLKTTTSENRKTSPLLLIDKKDGEFCSFGDFFKDDVDGRRRLHPLCVVEPSITNTSQGGGSHRMRDVGCVVQGAGGGWGWGGVG